MLSSHTTTKINKINECFRYAICHPLRHRSVLTTITVLLLISVLWAAYSVWVISVLLLLHYKVIHNLYVESFGRCSFTSSPAGETLVLLTYGLFFILPFLITTGLYIPIVQTMVQDTRKIDKNSAAHQISDKSRKRQRYRLKKAFIFITVLLILFFISWFPHVVNVYLKAFFNFKAPAKLSLGFIVLFYTNLFTDPLIYAFNCPLIRLPFQSVSEIMLGSTNAETKQASRDSILDPKTNETEHFNVISNALVVANNTDV